MRSFARRAAVAAGLSLGVTLVALVVARKVRDRQLYGSMYR